MGHTSTAVARPRRVAPKAPPKKVTTRRPATTARPSVVRRRSAPLAGRRLIGIVVGVVVVIVLLMLAVVAFQTQIAERQLRIDRIEAQIVAERDRYNALRLERSSLREPGRLVIEARALGMEPGRGAEFTVADPMTVAAVLVSTVDVEDELLVTEADPFETYGEFKATIASGR